MQLSNYKGFIISGAGTELELHTFCGWNWSRCREIYFRATAASLLCVANVNWRVCILPQWAYCSIRRYPLAGELGGTFEPLAACWGRKHLPFDYLRELAESLHAASAVSMAPSVVSILQIVGLLCSLTSAQFDDDLGTAYDPSSGLGSGQVPSDPTLVDYEYGDDFNLEDVNICQSIYPPGTALIIIGGRQQKNNRSAHINLQYGFWVPIWDWH